MIGAELCAGYGGLGLALEIAGIDHRTGWFAEIDDQAAAVMARHHPTATNVGDLTQIIDPPPADIVTAGFPCQPVSTAGRRQGVNDERWIIDDVCRVARLAGAKTLVLENVPGILTANDGDAMARVCEALAREGFSRWEWGTVRASDVGAPHQRKRWFCVAHSDGAGLERTQPERRRNLFARGAPPDSGAARRQGGRWTEGGMGSVDGPPVDRRTVADSDGGQPERRRELGELGGPSSAELGEGHQRQRTGHTARDRCPRFGGYAEAVARWEHILGRPAPDPTAGGRLSPRFVEWMMGLPDGWVTGTPSLSRAAQLRVLGNGVVPQQAAAAVELLGVVR